MNRSEAGKLGAAKSKAAHNQKHVNFVNKYLENPKKCKTCQKDIPFDKRYNDFCNHTCAATFNNKGVVHNGKKKNMFCLQCGKQLTLNSKKYCSPSCHANYRFENGITTSANAVRNYLIRNQGRVCLICKNTHWLGNPITLEVDHIDGNSGNNSVSNIRLICPNCHSMTPTYKNKNKGRGRIARRQIYQRGIIR